MCKYVLLILILVLIALMAVAAVVVQEYGWVGFLILLGILAILGFVVRKGTRPLLMYMVSRPLRRWGVALRGGRIIVLSVEPCDPPREEEYDIRDDPEAIEDEPEGERDEAADDEDVEQDEGEAEPAGPFDWYQIEFTVVPPGGESSEGRIVTRRGWSPQLIGAVGPRPQLGSTSPFRGWPSPGQFPDAVLSLSAEVWTGSEYETPVEMVFGEQRLRMRVGVTRTVQSVTITYAQFTDLGVLQLPRIDPTGADG
jgi:hypothetical protein